MHARPDEDDDDVDDDERITVQPTNLTTGRGLANVSFVSHGSWDIMEVGGCLVGA